jgi:Arc/MetJ-type ribon-helix-helix transcriptional regulator
MTIHLTPEQERRVQAVISRGAYESVEEVVDAALAAVEQRTVLGRISARPSLTLSRSRASRRNQRGIGGICPPYRINQFQNAQPVIECVATTERPYRCPISEIHLILL